jgi:hypothetical protein
LSFFSEWQIATPTIETVMELEEIKKQIGTMAVGSDIASVLDSLIGAVAKSAADALRERRLEVEARLRARLSELAELFRELDQTRVLQVEDRESQRQALLIILDLAKETRIPSIIEHAMLCFRQYSQSSPSYTKEFIDSLPKIEAVIELFPQEQPIDVPSTRAPG